MEELTIIKVGGAVVEDSHLCGDLLNSFSAIKGKKILVHGGGRTASKVAASMGIETQMIDGRRITDAQMLDVVTMVYGGLVNKRLVARLQSLGVNAIGLTGADMRIIESHRRPITNGIDYGFVGDIDKVDSQAISNLLEAGITPVVAPLTYESNGQLLNTNADTIVMGIAVAMKERYHVRLVYAFEKAGVLKDEGSVAIPQIRTSEIPSLISEGIVSGGMIPKLQLAKEAMESGVDDVIITSFSDLEGRFGTKISR